MSTEGTHQLISDKSRLPESLSLLTPIPAPPPSVSVPDRPLYGQIFFYGWIVLAFLILMNIFIAILMDAYSEAKQDSAACAAPSPQRTLVQSTQQQSELQM
jgi:hypothetical protein